MRIQRIGRRIVLALGAAAGALAMTTSAASAAGELPQQWNPRTVAVNHQDGNSFLLRPEQIIAIGDDVNDVPMLQNAGLGVAMGNARSEVQSAAKRVIGTNASDGLAQFLEELVAEHSVEPIEAPEAAA